MLNPNSKASSSIDFGPRVPLFTVKGAKSGPCLLVTGDETVLRAVAELCWARRELTAINGSLVFRPKDQDLGLDHAQFLLHVTHDDPKLAFEHVLGKMTKLGMIPALVADAA